MEEIEGSLRPCVGTANKWYKKLSYRKQIARKLCTQYVEGICSNSVTLKSGLEVTQGHYRSPSNLRHCVYFEATVLYKMRLAVKTKKLISRRDRRTLPLEPSHRCIIVLIMLYAPSHVSV